LDCCIRGGGRIYEPRYGTKDKVVLEEKDTSYGVGGGGREGEIDKGIF